MFPGRIVADKYRILRVLGRGGMGVVTEAERLDTGEHVAIKFLRDDIESDMQPIARFAREARLATKLQSLHTCKIFGVDESAYGPFIVMELLDGRPLNAVVAPGYPLSWPQAVRIAYEACVALGEAHAHGIVHRDIKPGNVFLAWSSQQRAITKVLDFGVAKIPAQAITYGGGPSLTDAALMLGTPAYVAPEQLNNSKHVDARADVWALGILLYEMLAGRVPFTSPHVPKLLVMIAREAPPALTALVPELPVELAQIVHRCLCKDPALRFPEAAALSTALLPWLDEQPDLLDPLLRMASLRPLRLISSVPPPTPNDILAITSVHERPAELAHPDSLGPHTTAGLARPPPKRFHRARAILLGSTLGLLASILAIALFSKPSKPTANVASIIEHPAESASAAAVAYDMTTQRMRSPATNPQTNTDSSSRASHKKTPTAAIRAPTTSLPQRNLPVPTKSTSVRPAASSRAPLRPLDNANPF